MNDFTHLIERLEAFEERCGVRLDALFASGDGLVTVNGELHPREGAELKQNIEVKVDVYDSARRLVSSSSVDFFMADFFGFATFSIYTGTEAADIANISKIRVYPKPM